MKIIKNQQIQFWTTASF